VLPVTAVASQHELARTSARASSTVFDHIHESGFDLVSVAEPLIAVSVEQLRAGLAGLNGAGSRVPIDPTTIEDILFTGVPRQLFALLGRTMVLELNVARVAGRLEGSTSEDRFQSFVHNIRTPEIAHRIMREYPALAVQLTSHLERWVTTSLEFTFRLCRDWNEIRRTFSPEEDPGPLVSLQSEAGDRHRQGRSVAICEFASGLRLVYKPKSLATDVHFQELLSWTNGRGAHPAFRTLQILDRGSHGWVEFVAAATCDSIPKVRRFYERQGAYLALLYALEATDVHCENVIAAGEHPMVIDLEALFQARCPAPETPLDIDSAAIAHSVLRVGLLPWRDWSNVEPDGIDLSGLGGAAGQLTPYAIPDWEAAGTDQMHLTRRRMAISADQNRPTLNGDDVDPCDYVADVSSGFAGMYHMLLEQRAELLSADGPLHRFATDEVRAILRPTRTYRVLWSESFHPDVLRNARDRERMFDRLRIAVESRPYLASVVAAERDDLQQGDVPLFTTRPAVRDLWTSRGERVPDFFHEPALARVRRRVLQLDTRDLDRQLWLIRASMASVAPSPASSSRPAISHDRLLAAARTVGDRLEAIAIRSEDEASWIGLMLATENQWTVAPLTVDLYDGLPGVILFLAYLGATSGEARYTALARAACSTMLRRVKECESFATSIGAFDGWGGIIYALAHLSVLWNAPELSANVDALVERLFNWIPRDEQLDIVGGAAGCLGALLALYERRPSQRVLTAAVACGDHLLSHLQQTEHGVGWTIPGQRAPLAGYAHGAAGIAWALLKLADATRNERFRATARAAIAHERSLFSPEVGNWRDLRVREASGGDAAGESFMTAWCNGAPGIGLARLSTIATLDDAVVRDEIDTALRTTVRDGFGQNHSLCHGELGNLELLLQAEHRLGDKRWVAAASRLASPIVERVEKQQWLCGTPLNVDSPGLMTGLAGIGFGLLRWAAPTHVPSVLLLEPPLPPQDREQ
jgi:type 2 lantibiotic biosynthesis protein LanM